MGIENGACVTLQGNVVQGNNVFDNHQRHDGYATEANWQTRVTTRADFVQKVYLHLFGAILAFVAIQTFLFQTGMAETIARAMLGVSWLLVLGGFMLVGWFGSRVAHTASSLPAQYAALAAFVVAEALIFVPILYLAMRVAPNVIQPAALLTLGGFTGLTAIAFFTRKDFSFLRGVLMWGGLCAILAIVGGVIFGLHLGMWFSVAMVAFAGAAILYDTSNVLHHYPEDRYVGAALSLFASVALLFWYVLRIFLSRE